MLFRIVKRTGFLNRSDRIRGAVVERFAQASPESDHDRQRDRIQQTGLNRHDQRKTDIEVEELITNDFGPGTRQRRYVIRYNPAQARRNAAARAEIVASLRTKLKAGDNGKRKPLTAE